MFLFIERTLVKNLLEVSDSDTSQTFRVWRFCFSHSAATPNPAFLFLMQFSNHYSEFIGKWNSFHLSETSQPMWLWWCISHSGGIFRIAFFSVVQRGMAIFCIKWGILSLCCVIPAQSLEWALFTSIIQLRLLTLFMLDSFNHHRRMHCLYCKGNHWEMTLLDWDTGCHHHFSCAQWTQKTQNTHSLLLDYHIRIRGFRLFQEGWTF